MKRIDWIIKRVRENFNEIIIKGKDLLAYDWIWFDYFFLKISYDQINNFALKKINKGDFKMEKLQTPDKGFIELGNFVSNLVTVIETGFRRFLVTYIDDIEKNESKIQNILNLMSNKITVEEMEINIKLDGTLTKGKIIAEGFNLQNLDHIEKVMNEITHPKIYFNLIQNEYNELIRKLKSWIEDEDEKIKLYEDGERFGSHNPYMAIETFWSYLDSIEVDKEVKNIVDTVIQIRHTFIHRGRWKPELSLPAPYKLFGLFEFILFETERLVTLVINNESK